MLIRSHDAKRHDRFYVGDDRDFIGQSFDWSGIGKTSSGRWATMISPSYFLSATHYAPGAGNQVTFYPGNDAADAQVYTVEGGQAIVVGGVATDLWLGRLTTSLRPEDSITYYPILLQGATASYLGMELFNYGKPDRVGRNVLDDIAEAEDENGRRGLSMIYDYDNQDVPDVGGDETYLQTFDSGGPSFTVWNGALALLGIHWFIDDNPPEGLRYSGDTFVPHYVADISSRMSDESPTLVPEPATLALWSAAALLTAACGAVRRYRRTRQPSRRVARGTC
ncbi:MAG: hypothetical protein MUF48_03625 [Pirellulaceae bacterium]|jgi:hypothetical protein|nr:hypothetical protein [Pirellulaceae bacterium]